MSNPKLFISYNRSGFEFEEFVFQIAAELRASGVDAILDKWSAEESLDLKNFTVNNLSNPEIKKIAIISDKFYVEKSAVENTKVSPIISKELYETRKPETFALIITEKDEKGKAYIPEYFRSDVFIDLSEPDSYADNFDKLLRWIYDKPLYKKPEIGEMPEFLINDENISLGTSAAYKMAVEAIKNHKPTMEGRIDEYLTLFTENLERFRIADKKEDFAEAVYKNIAAFKPFKDEYLQLLITLARYNPDIDYEIGVLHFIEQLLSYSKPSEIISGQNDWEFDNYLFIVHELFLYTIAVFLKFERFEEAALLLGRKYYVAGKAEIGQEEIMSFDKIHHHIESIENYNKSLDTKLESFRAILIKERCAGSGIEFRDLMQADFTIFLKAEHNYQPYYSQWYPETLMFLKHFRGAFEIFARARSKEYFDKMKVVFGIETPEGLSDLITLYKNEKRQMPRGLNPNIISRLTNFKSLATLP